jgi:hypothetical protein
MARAYLFSRLQQLTPPESNAEGAVVTEERRTEKRDFSREEHEDQA